MRKLLIALVVLAVAFVATDRIAVAIAEDQISSRVASAYGLTTKPQVTIEGFPFLTQVVAGDYQRVDVSVGSVQADGLDLRQLQARFSNVHASLSQVLGHGAATVTAASATGSAVVSYAEVQRQMPAGIKLAPDGNHLQVSGTVTFQQLRVPVTATVALSVTPAGVEVRPTNVSVAGGFNIPTGALTSSLGFVIPVHSLPMHLTLTSVAVTPQGLRVGAAAQHVHFARA